MNAATSFQRKLNRNLCTTSHTAKVRAKMRNPTGPLVITANPRNMALSAA